MSSQGRCWGALEGCEGWPGWGSSSGVRKTLGPSGDPWPGGRKLGKGIERGVRACAGVMPVEREEGMEQRDSGGQGGGMGSGD